MTTPLKELSLMQWSPTLPFIIGVNERIFVWHYDNNEINQVASFKDNEYEVTALTFNPKGDLFATGDLDFKITIREINLERDSFIDQKPKRVIEMEDSICSLLWDPLGKYFLALLLNNELVVFKC